MGAFRLFTRLRLNSRWHTVYWRRRVRRRPLAPFAQTRVAVRNLAVRRTVRRRIATLELRRIRPGVWYDPRADVHYAAASWAPAGGWNDE